MGPLPPHPMPGIKYNMETVDEDILDYSVKFIDKAKAAGKPFFVWVNSFRFSLAKGWPEAGNVTEPEVRALPQIKEPANRPSLAP